MRERAPRPARRRRGEPRRLLLEAARELFGRRDFRATTTREIAQHAGVAEHLLFRAFGSKAALFREALVTPFVEVVESFEHTWRTLPPDAREEDVARDLHGALFDLFVGHRGLVLTLLTADALQEDELAETGLAEVRRAVAVLGRLGSEGLRIKGLRARHHDLAARTTVAMIAGMATFGASLFEGRPPSRDELVDELTQMTLHGFLHREE